MKITGFKNIGGQDIVTQVDEEGYWIDPFFIYLEPNPPGQPPGARKTIAPYLMDSEDGIFAPNLDVVAGSFTVSSKLKDAYINSIAQMNASKAGIQLAPKAKIIMP